jgi:mannose-1-phosphate guanylyltransferase/phosphomannomutase
MKAIILAGGLGTRLHPLTVNLPKPMVPMANRPIMSYIVELLAQHGFCDIQALLYHKPETIKDYFGDGKDFKVKIEYTRAEKDYGTAGAVKYACRNYKGPLLIISADLVTNADLSSFLKFHKKKKAVASMALVRINNPLQYGIVITENGGRITKFLEKPSWGEVFSDTINAGIYLLEPGALDFIPEEKKFDFSLDLFPMLLGKGKPIYGFISPCYWKDVGKLEEYSQTHCDLLNGETGLEIQGYKKNGNKVWLGEDVEVSASAKISGYCQIGEGSIIEDKAAIANTIIGKNCRVGHGAVLSESILWDNVTVKDGAKLERTVVCNNAVIGDGSRLREGVVVGENTRVGRQAQVKPYIKIWPDKTIEEDGIVSSSMIWRKSWTRSVFGQFGVTGIYTEEITPQFAASLGAAFGSVLGKGARISCSRDSHKTSHMICNALVSGALSAGVNVSDLKNIPIPIHRYEVRSRKSAGGFHVRKSPFDPRVIDIKFFDASGMDLKPKIEKEVERIFFAENFTRTGVDEAGELTYPFHRVAEEYETDLFSGLDKKAIASAGPRLVIDYSYGSASQIFPAILGELGLEVVSLDAYIDETKITKDKASFERSLHQMTNIVRSVRADFGVMLDTGAEKVFLCDELGNLIDGHRALAIMALMIFRSEKNAIVAVPIKESIIIDEIAEKYGGKVVRTKNTFRDMMEIAAIRKVSFVGECHGGYIFSGCQPCFDGMLSICKIAEHIAREKTKLSHLAAEIAQVNLLGIDIDCSSEQKGKIMRQAADLVKDADKVETIDGFKFWHGRSWVLILPDASKPIIHLYAEAANPKATQKLLKRYSEKIIKLRDKQ